MQSLTASSHGDIASCPHCRLLYIANIESELAEALKDTQRLDYLIRQWPPGAAESLGLNEEIWDAATGHARTLETDEIAVRMAIDDAIASELQKELK